MEKIAVNSCLLNHIYMCIKVLLLRFLQLRLSSILVNNRKSISEVIHLKAGYNYYYSKLQFHKDFSMVISIAI